MVTKEELKKEVDKLPDGLLDEVYALLKSITQKTKGENRKWTLRNFKGKLDQADLRAAAYE